jgi:hypothetical protein
VHNDYCITISSTYTCVTISNGKAMQNMTLNAMSISWVCLRTCFSIHSTSRYTANANLNMLIEEAYSATGGLEAENLIPTMTVQQKIEVLSEQGSLGNGNDLIRGGRQISVSFCICRMMTPYKEVEQ